MKKIIFILLLLTFNFSLFTSVLAQSSTDSATQVPPELVQENIKKRLEKVAGEATAENQKRAWVGTLQDIANQTLTLKTKTDTRQASFDADTVFVESPGNKALKSTDLELESNLIVMGFTTGNHVLDAKRVVVVTNFTPPPQRNLYLGTIVNFTKNQLEFTTLTDQQAMTVPVTSKTYLTQDQDQAETDTDALVSQAKVLVITQTSKTGDLITLRLHLL